MDLDLLRFVTEIATVGGTAIAAFVSVRLALNGMKRDMTLTRCDLQELKGSLSEAAQQRANLDIRLTIVESDVKHISNTLTRMENS